MPAAPLPPSHARVRLWRAFLGGRVLVAWVLLALLLLQAWSLPTAVRVPSAAWVVTGTYVLASSMTWLLARQQPLPPLLDWGWLLILGVDIAAIFSLQIMQVHSMHYTPLLALPILMAATLGHLLLAWATTATITLLLLGWNLWSAWQSDPRSPEHYVQTALTCAAYFVLAYLAHLLAQRLAREEQRSQQHQQHAQAHAHVNGLIIEHLAEGVLVLDLDHRIHMANPAAQQLLGSPTLTHLRKDPAWVPLRQLVERSFALQQAQAGEVSLLSPGKSPVGLYARTWLTPASPEHAHAADIPQQASLCVMFLDDLREAQARLRTEKLAAMGRMSAAVAHEIRNPLAAIVQANALLAEDLQQPHQLRLSGMVQQNSERLARIAEEILDIARVQNQIQHTTSSTLVLDAQAHAIWQEWRQQLPGTPIGKLQVGSHDTAVEFEAEHLRRVVVNLLDNARRYASAHADALQLLTGQPTVSTAAWLQVWSDGTPLDASVERHLFEPFFSSQSRSTGLGLYICRELCQRYGASLQYQRMRRPTARGLLEGNAFTIVFRHSSQPTASPSRSPPIVV